MGENEEDFDIDFNEGFLGDVDASEELYYTQRGLESQDPPSKRRKISLSPPAAPRSALQPISHRKNRLLDIFSPDSSNQTSQTQRTSENLKNSSGSPKNPRSSWKPSGKSSALGVFNSNFSESRNLPKTPEVNKKFIKTPEIIRSVAKTPQRFPKTSPTEKILEPRRVHPNASTVDQLHSKTVVRKFPGPAGLIPDDLDPSQPPENLLRLLDESDAKTSPEKIQTDFCTQETKKIFLEGAWRHMLDDLPKNFLAGYDVNSIKESDATKVPFLALVIQQIDQGSENPRVTLKDISGSIDGIIHRDLALNHPNILHSSVVLLLQNVGVLSIKKTSFVKSKVVVISMDSLIAAYSEKGALVRTPLLDTISRGEMDKMVAVDRSIRPISIKSIDHRSESKNRISDSPLDISDEIIDTSRKRIISKKSADQSRNPVDNSSRDVADREKSTIKEADDFADANFNFEDDIFNEIDMTQFDGTKAEGVSVIETVAVIETREEQENEQVTNDETSTGFADDLFNASDSDDEYFSQLDMEALTKHPSMS